MQRFLLKQFKDNSALRDYTSKSSHLRSASARRSAVRIAVIDDQPFSPQANLHSYGYKIDAIGDIKQLDEVISYHIVLCDIMGVGRHFDSNLQGASLISEIKKKYPEKIVIAYTAAALNDKTARIASGRADAILKKDIDIEEWTAALDKYCVEAIDPFIVWNKIRRRFIELDVPTPEILLLEDAYVRSMESKDYSLAPLTRAAISIGSQTDVRAIVQGLASSMIFKFVFGV